MFIGIFLLDMQACSPVFKGNFHEFQLKQIFQKAQKKKIQLPSSNQSWPQYHLMCIKQLRWEGKDRDSVINFLNYITDSQ